MIKKMLLFGYRVWNQPDGSADNRNLGAHVAKTHFFPFHKAMCRPSEHLLGWRINPKHLTVNQYATGITDTSDLSFSRETTFIWQDFTVREAPTKATNEDKITTSMVWHLEDWTDPAEI